jgi:hypothetical protein
MLNRDKCHDIDVQNDRSAQNLPLYGLARNLLSPLLLEKNTEWHTMARSTEKVKVVAEQHGWTLAHAQGYLDGQRSRKRGNPPPPYTVIGIDEYCLGFRAGYFGPDRKSRPTRHTVS